MRNPLSRARVALLGIPFLLVACGGGGGDGNPPAASAPPVASAADKCKAFAGTSLAGASINDASLVAASAASAEYCKVTGTLHSTLNFELHLPTVWNNKLLYAGGGGWDGSISIVPNSPSGSTGGYGPRGLRTAGDKAMASTPRSS
jgi:hypothetical protein